MKLKHRLYIGVPELGFGERLSFIWGDIIAAVVCRRRGHAVVRPGPPEYGCYYPCKRCGQKVSDVAA